MTNLLALVPRVVPDPSPQAPPGAERFLPILDWLYWGGIVAAIGAGFILAILLIARSAAGNPRPMSGNFMYFLAGMILLGSVSTLVGWLLR
jgi:hypothetical protein